MLSSIQSHKPAVPDDPLSTSSIFAELIVSGSDPSSFVIGTTIVDSTPPITYTFTGQTGDTGSIVSVGSKYALDLNKGTLMSNKAWTLNTRGLTCMAWVRLRSYRAYDSLCGFGDTSLYYGFTFKIHNGYLVCTQDINNTVNDSGMSVLQLNTWYHVCCAANSVSRTKRYYINGTNVGGTIISDVATNASSFMTNENGIVYYVGTYSPYYYRATQIDDTYKNRVRLFNSVLTDTQVAAYYNTEVGLA